MEISKEFIKCRLDNFENYAIIPKSQKAKHLQYSIISKSTYKTNHYQTYPNQTYHIKIYQIKAYLLQNIANDKTYQTKKFIKRKKHLTQKKHILNDKTYQDIIHIHNKTYQTQNVSKYKTYQTTKYIEHLFFQMITEKIP